jgi:acetoacetyl-CoA synthetase
MSTVGKQIWTPEPAAASRSALAQFGRWLREVKGVDVDEADYAGLHAWSVDRLEDFWQAAAEFLGVRFHDQPHRTLTTRIMPGARWFPGSTLNYAEHALTPGPGRQNDDVAVIFAREDGLEGKVTHAELRDAVARARAGLQRAGVGLGDRVAAYAPNSPETLVMFLATASLGAIWSSCSPDFGTRAVRERFAQIEPTVLLAVDGYVYGGKRFDVTGNVGQLMEALPTLRQTILVPYLNQAAHVDGATGWADFTSETGPLDFAPVPFDHPLWVLYSSGTTGLPKGIVHSHGGIVLEHLKSLRLHHDLGPGQRFFWFSTTGWMMWNLLVSGLLVGATLVLYDGSPAHPDLGTLWRLAERHRITVFGTSAPYLHSCLKAGLVPSESVDVSSIRSVGSTGAPLSADGFRWVAEAVGETIQIASVSGGTDVCTAFLGCAPTVPVWLEELSCAVLGVRAAAYDESGREVLDQLGELVITEPMPSMPVSFWNDADGSRLRDAYFVAYPGVWRHGDWIKRTPHGSFVVYGRSDSTLNRGGVRMGTADFYAVVEAFDEVADSLVIDTTQLAAADEGALLCFLVLGDGTDLALVEPQLRMALRRQLSPRHVPDRFIAVAAVPHTLNGKKCEVPVKKILAGVDPSVAVSKEALANPESLVAFVQLAAELNQR